MGPSGKAFFIWVGFSIPFFPFANCPTPDPTAHSPQIARKKTTTPGDLESPFASASFFEWRRSPWAEGPGDFFPKGKERGGEGGGAAKRGVCTERPGGPRRREGGGFDAPRFFIFFVQTPPLLGRFFFWPSFYPWVLELLGAGLAPI